MCACLELWRGGSGEVGHKLCFQQNKWPAGLQGRLHLNTFFFFSPSTAGFVVQSRLKYRMPKLLLLSFQSVHRL